jgi:hypothetical protein
VFQQPFVDRSTRTYATTVQLTCPSVCFPQQAPGWSSTVSLIPTGRGTHSALLVSTYCCSMVNDAWLPHTAAPHDRTCLFRSDRTQSFLANSNGPAGVNPHDISHTFGPGFSLSLPLGTHRPTLLRGLKLKKEFADLPTTRQEMSRYSSLFKCLSCLILIIFY